MPKYNSKVVPVTTKTTTLQGGDGYTQKPEFELVGLLATGLGETFYEKESDREKRFVEIFTKVAAKDATFAAKALVYARTVMGQRSITHRGAIELAKYLSGTELGKKFYTKRNRKTETGGVVFRLDDMSEILACYKAKKGVKAPIPNAIKKGFKEAIENADMYELAKYQMKGRGVSLVDIVNLVHPTETLKNGYLEIPLDEYLKVTQGTKLVGKPYEKGKEVGTVKVPALRALVLGILKQFNTVEDKNTEAGKVVAEKVKSGQLSKDEAAKVLNEAKTDNYVELIKTKKIGYLALLRNLRNILKTNNNEVLDLACDLLVDEKFIKKSLVFPYQIDLALEVLLTEFSTSTASKLFVSLNTAYELSIPNLKELFQFGKTAVVLDVSGSMTSLITLDDKKRGKSSALDKGALIGATLAKGLNADTYVFADRCAQANLNILDSVNTVKNNLIRNHPNVGGSTMWGSIFPALTKKYDRIFIISDEQGADSVERTYRSYCDTYGKPHTYVINMCGYGPTMIKQDSKVHRIYGYHAGIYETAKQVEIDPNAIIKEIQAIVI